MPGATRTLAYDALQRPIHIKSQAIGQGTHEAPAGDLIMDYRYTYDAAGNITQRETEEGAYQYGYDLIDRLTNATPPQNLQQNPASPEADKLPVEAYSYDSVHNRLSSQHQPGLWQYNQDNQLQGYGIGTERRTYTYNANGHTQTEVTGDPATKTREFIYNAAERLIEIKDNNQTIGQYQYDPMGRRIKKQTQEGTTWFLYADEGLIAELDQAGSPTRYYGWKPNGLWGTDPLWLADKANNTWQTYLYQNDHLWTPQRLTDTQGEIQWSGRTKAFGKTAATTNLINNHLRFPGQYEDGVGLNQNYFRDYRPDQGRYIQSDPIGLDGGLNLYLYSEAMPVGVVDNDGLQPRPRAHLGTPNPNICTVFCNASGNMAIQYGCLKTEHEECGLKQCITDHEQVHIEDIRSVGWGGICKLNRRSGSIVLVSPNSFRKWTEQKAYLNSIICVSKLIEEESKKECPECMDLLLETRDHWYDKFEENSR